MCLVWLSVPPAKKSWIRHCLFPVLCTYKFNRLYNQEYIALSHSIIARDRPPARPEPSLHVNIGMAGLEGFKAHRSRSPAGPSHHYTLTLGWIGVEGFTSARRTGSLTLDEESEGCLFLVSGRHDSMSDRIANHIAWASIFFFCA